MIGPTGTQTTADWPLGDARPVHVSGQVTLTRPSHPVKSAARKASEDIDRLRGQIRREAEMERRGG